MEDLDQKIAELNKDIDAVKAEMLKRQEQLKQEQEKDNRRTYSCSDTYCD